MSVLVVEARNSPQTIASLGMRCNENELVEPLGNAQAMFWVGIGKLAVRDNSEKEPDDVGWRFMADEDPISLAVAGNRMYAIIGPRSPIKPAVWISSPLSKVKSSLGPAIGLFKKRPRSVSMEGELNDWMLGVLEVGRLFPRSARMQPGQAQSLYDAMTSGTLVQP